MDLNRFVYLSTEPRRDPEWKDAPAPSANAWNNTAQTKILREDFLNPAASKPTPNTKPCLPQEEPVASQGSHIKPAVYLGYAIIRKPSAGMPAIEKTLLLPEPKGTRAEQRTAADAIEDLYNRDSEDSESLPDYT